MADSSAIFAVVRSPPNALASAVYRSPPRPPRRTPRLRPARPAPAAPAGPRRLPPAPSPDRRSPRGAAAPRNLQRAAAPGRPAPRDHPAHQVLRPEPAARHPGVQPRPAEAPRAAGPAPCTPAAAGSPGDRSRAAPRTWSTGPARRRSARARTSWAGESGFTGRPWSNAADIRPPGRPAGPAAVPPGRRGPRRPRPEQLGQQLVVYVGPPRQPGRGHLRGDQSARRFGRHQQPEPSRLLVGRDAGQLVGVHRDQVGQRGRGLGQAVLRRFRRVEQRRLRPVPGRTAGRRHRPAVQPGGCRGQVGGLARGPSRLSSSRSVSVTSWQRSTRTPAASSAGYSSAVSATPSARRRARSCSPTAAARSAARMTGPADPSGAGALAVSPAPAVSAAPVGPTAPAMSAAPARPASRPHPATPSHARRHPGLGRLLPALAGRASPTAPARAPPLPAHTDCAPRA